MFRQIVSRVKCCSWSHVLGTPALAPWVSANVTSTTNRNIFTVRPGNLRSFSTSLTFAAYDRELFSESILLSNKKFILDVKKPESGSTYMKVVEFSRGRKSYLLLNLSDIVDWSTNLRQMKDKAPGDPVVRFECSGEAFSFEVKENNLGSFVNAAQYVKGLERPYNLFIPMDGVTEICDKIDSILNKI